MPGGRRIFGHRLHSPLKPTGVETVCAQLSCLFVYVKVTYPKQSLLCRNGLEKMPKPGNQAYPHHAVTAGQYLAKACGQKLKLMEMVRAQGVREMADGESVSLLVCCFFFCSVPEAG